MNPEERVKLVIDIVAEEILRQMREMQEAAESETAPLKPVSPKKEPVSAKKRA
ncbi:MAG: hypothetical protein ABIH66_09235 [bacterium]